MRDKLQGHRWDPVLLVVGLLFLSSLACNGLGDRVQPDNPDLQPPISNIGMELSQFLQWIGTVPSDTLPPPWIVQPPSNICVQTATVDVRGFAVRAGDRPELVPQSDSPVVTLYSVTGSAYPPTIKAKLAEVVVDDSRSWAVSGVALDTSVDTYLAARVSNGGAVSNWSNVVQLYRMENVSAVTIDSPANDATFPLGTLTVAAAGRSPGHSTVTLFRRSHSSAGEPTTICLGSTRSDAEGRWQMDAVAIIAGDNTWFARVAGAQGPLESADVLIRREALLWPVANPAGNKTISQWYTTGHPALDIALGSNPPDVLAAASGSVTVLVYCVPKDHPLETPFDACEKAYINLKVDKLDDCQVDPETLKTLYVGYGLCVIVTHDGVWQGYRTLYAHLGSVAVKTGDSVTRGATLGVADSTGCSTGNHLHFEIQRQDRGGSWSRVNLNPPSEIPQVFCRTDASPGEDLLGFDWRTCVVKLRGKTDKSCTEDLLCTGGDQQ